MNGTGHRNPLLYAWWLEATGHLSRLRAALILGSVVTLIILALRFGSQVLAATAPHVVTLGISAAVATSVWVQGRRRKWLAYYSQGWLSALPVSRLAVTLTMALRSVFLPIIVAAALMVLIAAAGIHAAGDQSAAAHLAWSLGIAAIVGSLLGWWMPKRKAGARDARRLYTVAASGKQVTQLAALSQWTALQTRQWFDPRALSRLFLIFLLAAPMGISANEAVMVMALLAIGLYLAVVQLAALRVMRVSRTWLLPTPLSTRRMAWAVLRSALFRQCLWTAVAAATLIACGLAPVVAVRIAEWWLALCGVTTAVLTANANRPRANGLRLGIALAFMMLIDRLRPHLVLPTALWVAIFQFRKLERA